MLDTLRSGYRWVTTVVIGTIALVFVLYLGLQGPLTMSRTAAVVEVGPYKFGFREFERARERREQAFQEQFGAQYDARALSDTLDQITTRELVDRALLAIEAQNLGLSVSKQEIERLVLADPGFRDEGGSFDVKAFEGWAQHEYGSQTAFIEERRLALLSYKMLELLHGQPQVSEAEAREAVRRDLEEVQIAFVAIGGDAAKDLPAPDDAAVKKALAERGEALRALYEERSGVYNAPEKIHARHILFDVPSDADEAKVEAVRQEAEAALAALRGGADFAELAAKRSDDPGSKINGGDLGFFPRGQMVPAFEEAAFALQPGQLSELVKTSFGFHIIRLEERQAAVSRSYDEVSEELARELLQREAARVKAREQVDALAAAVRGGKTLEQAAREAGLTLQRPGGLRRRPDGYVPGLGPAQELLAAAFTSEAGSSSPRVFEVGEKLVLFQVLERTPAPADRIDPQVAARREQLLNEKRDARTSAWLDRRRDQLIKSGELMVALENLGRRPQPRK